MRIKSYLVKTLVIVDPAIADQLNLGNSGDRLQIRMQDGFLGGLSLVVAMTVGLGSGVEGFGKSVLSLWSEVDIFEE